MRSQGGVAIGPVEREMHAHEAQASATVLAVLTFLWGAVAVSLVPPAFRLLNYLHMTAGATAIAYFVATRKRPRIKVAYAFSAVAIVSALVLLPWTTLVWSAAHRPFEATIVPQIGMFCMALVVPRSLLLGVAVMMAFLAEGLFVTVWAYHVGQAALLPVGEPVVTIMFCLPAIALLLLREQRRRLARRHILVHAETEALRRLGPLFSRVRQELTAQLAVLAAELRAAGSNGGSAAAASMERAVGRLVGVDARLDDLAESSGAPLSAATTAPATGKAHPVATELERRLLARDAQLGAVVLAAIGVSVTAVWAPVAWRALGAGVGLRNLAIAGVGSILLAWLWLTRHRPTERRGRLAIFLLFVGALVPVSLDQGAFLAAGRPFMPFLGHKLLMVSLGLAAASWSSMGLPFILITAADAIVLYFVLGFNHLKERMAIVEPWVTLVYLVVAVVALVLRDQRRVASLAVLRTESEGSALHRHALMLLALRDQLNTPLQTLVAGAARLELQQPGQDLTRIHAAIARLVALSRELAQLEIPRESQVASIGADALRRAAPPPPVETGVAGT